MSAINNPSGIRIIASGRTTAAIGTTTVTTTTRNANERLLAPAMWLVPDVAAVRWAPDVSPSTLGIVAWFERTVNPNEFKMFFGNGTASARDIDWVIMGVTP